MGYRDFVDKASDALKVGDFATARSIADSLSDSIEQESDSYVLFSSGEKCNPMEFFLSIGQIYGCLQETRDLALECYKKANLYSVIVHPEVVKANRTVYSFRPFNEYTLTDLINNTLTVCSPLNMNDPSDTLLFDWEHARELKCREYDIQPDCRDMAERLFKSEVIFRDSLRFYRIRCFSVLSPNGIFPYQNTLMWSHYAASHKGICIEYSMSPIMQANKNQYGFQSLRKVHYTDEPINLFENQEFDGEKALYYKHKDWEYENEVRLLTYFHTIPGDYFSIPLDEESKVTAVYFGLQCPEAQVIAIKNILKSTRGIRFYKMVKDYSNIYSLATVPV